MLIVLDDITADVLSNEKRILIVTELLIRGRKLHIFLVFFSHNLIFLYLKMLDQIQAIISL